MSLFELLISFLIWSIIGCAELCWAARAHTADFESVQITTLL